MIAAKAVYVNLAYILVALFVAIFVVLVIYYRMLYRIYYGFTKQLLMMVYSMPELDKDFIKIYVKCGQKINVVGADYKSNRIAELDDKAVDELVNNVVPEELRRIIDKCRA